MKKENNHFTDEWLDAIGPIREPETDDYFYTRLRARMEKPAPSLPFKPGWVIAVFSLLLVLNGITLLRQQFSQKPTITNSSVNPVQSVADTYDIRLSSTNY